MTDVLLIVWWLVAGWCGTPPRTGSTPALSSKRPLMTALVGLVGALSGGGLFMVLYPVAESSNDIVHYAVSGLPALVLARIFSDIFAAVALGPQPEPPD